MIDGIAFAPGYQAESNTGMIRSRFIREYQYGGKFGQRREPGQFAATVSNR